MAVAQNVTSSPKVELLNFVAIIVKKTMKCTDFKKLNKIFIVSSGRTGTKFFGKNLCKLSDSIFSIHEPDKLSIRNDKIYESIKKIRDMGFTHAIIKKLLGTHGSRNLSLKKLSQKLSQESIQKRLLKDRIWLPSNIGIYIEANSQLYGVIDELLTLNNSKVILLVRDPRDWVASWMNREVW